MRMNVRATVPIRRNTTVITNQRNRAAESFLKLYLLGSKKTKLLSRYLCKTKLMSRLFQTHLSPPSLKTNLSCTSRDSCLFIRLLILTTKHVLGNAIKIIRQTNEAWQTSPKTLEMQIVQLVVQNLSHFGKL